MLSSATTCCLSHFLRPENIPSFNPFTTLIPFHTSITMARFSFLAAGLAFAGLVTAAPVQDINTSPSNADMLQVIGEIGIGKAIQASCAGQSCAIADLSGSTGNPITVQPEGGDQNGYKCIAKYNPEGVAAAAKAPKGPHQNNGVGGALMGTLSSISSALPGKVTDSGTFTGRCTKNILLFARGTTETGQLGITVGPVLSLGLSGRAWSVVGIPYDADMAGDACLGLPGGMVAKDMINQAAAKWYELRLKLDRFQWNMSS